MSRVLPYQNGIPVAVDPGPGAAAPALGTSRAGDNSIIPLGVQRFVIPDVVIFWGGQSADRSLPSGQLMASSARDGPQANTGDCAIGTRDHRQGRGRMSSVRLES